jgi:hypothetical protein
MPALAASILRLSLLLRFCFFLLFFDEGEAGSASVVSSCASMGSSFDDGGTPAAAAPVLRLLLLLRFRPFPLLAMLVAVGVAGCAYVVNSCALTGLSFNNGGAPSEAASARSFRFRSFLLLFGEAMLVRVGGVVWERAAGRMFRVCVDSFSKIKAYVDFIMLELLIFCACALSHHVCVLEV